MKKSLAPKTPLQERESEKLAILATQGFHDLKEKYRMIRPAGLHNIFVNSGLKEEGLCWHWARDFQKRLQKLNLQSYDILWATAHAGKLREHNSVVIVSKGGSLEEGLVLDGWRHSGEPFWTLVAGDEYPWKPGEYFGEEGESP